MPNVSVKLNLQTIKVKFIQAAKELPSLETGFATALALNVTCTVYTGSWVSALCTVACAAAVKGENWAKKQDPVVVHLST